MKLYVTLSLMCASAFTIENSTDDSRKHYGLSLNKCPEFLKTFSCMSACKSIGFQIFRLDTRCKCTCHEMKTTTILPFFKWRTNGTTGTVPRTQSPNLYHVVGTLSPPTESVPPVPTADTNAPECIFMVTSNTTGTEADGNSTGTGTGADALMTTGGGGASADATGAAVTSAADETTAAPA